MIDVTGSKPTYRKFSSFKSQEDLTAVLGISVRERLLTPGDSVVIYEPDDALQKMIVKALKFPLHTEKIISEALIFPVLIEIASFFRDKISFFSGVEWETVRAPSVQLKGVCDFIIGGLPEMSKPIAPMICVVEAKKENFESGTYQCAAELFACKINNEAAGIDYPFYFGCVTIGREWNFIRLDCKDNILLRDTFFYSIGNLSQLLGVWKWVIETQLASVSPKISE